MRIEQRELAAYHEAGHAVADVRLALCIPERVTIELDGTGLCASSIRGPPTLEVVEECVIARLAGFAAEARRRHWGRLDAGLRIASAMEKLPPGDDGDLSRSLTLLAPYHTDTKRRLLQLWDETWRLVGQWWRDVERVALALLDSGRIESDELLGFLS